MFTQFDALARRIDGASLGNRQHGDDGVPVDRHGMVLEYDRVRLHRNDPACLDDQIDRLRRSGTHLHLTLLDSLATAIACV